MNVQNVFYILCGPRFLEIENFRLPCVILQSRSDRPRHRLIKKVGPYHGLSTNQLQNSQSNPM